MAGLTIKTTLINKRTNSTGYKFQTTMPLYNHTYDNVFLKDGTSILTPTFIVERPNIKALNTLPLCNYLYCEEFLRYYWIRDVKTGSGRQGGSGYFIELICEVDVLASWLAEIKGTPCWLKYCSDMDTTLPNSNTKLVDLSLDDDRLSPEIVFGTAVTSAFEDTNHNPFSENNSSAGLHFSYITKISSMGSGASMSCYHVMNADNFRSFVYSIYKDGAFSGVANLDDLVELMVQKVGGIQLDPTNFIEDTWVVPIPYSRFTAIQSEEDVYVGSIHLLKYNYNPNDPPHPTSDGYLKSVRVMSNVIDFYKLQNNVVEVSLLNNGGRYDTGSDAALIPFLRRKKYTKIILRTPNGELDLSSDSYSVNNAKLKIKTTMAFDLITGDYSITAWDFNTEEFLGKIHGNISCKIGKLLSGSGTAMPMLGVATKAMGSIFSVGAGGVGGLAADIFNKDVGKGLNKTLSITGKGMREFGGSFSGGCTSGSVNSDNNAWIDFLELASIWDSSSSQWTFDTNNTFQFVTSGFVPYPCMVYEDYEAFGKLWGFPVEKYLPKGIKDIPYYSFVQCSNFNIRCGIQGLAVPDGSGGMKMLVSGMLPEEAEQINNFLDTGIYLEEDPLPPE